MGSIRRQMSDRNGGPNGHAGRSGGDQVTIGWPNVDTLVLFIARSQIVVAAQKRDAMVATRSQALPTGFDEVDFAILEWIVAEGRRVGRRVPRL
jgi:hypothetical protein